MLATCDVLGQSNKFVIDYNNKTKQFNDSVSAINWAEQFVLKQKSKGFLSANYQQITPYNYSIETGQRFNHYAFELDGTPILKTGLLAKQEQLNKILRNNLNAGFPFYRIKTDSIVSDEKINNVYLSSNSGSFVVNGEIKTKQNVVKKRVLANLMSWKKGDAFQLPAW